MLITMTPFCPTPFPPPPLYPQMISGVVDYIPFNKALVLESVKDDSEELKKKIRDLDRTIQDRFNYLEV